MKAENFKALGLLLLGFVSILFLASFTFEEFQMKEKGGLEAVPAPYFPLETVSHPSPRVEPPKDTGAFHPFTEEYLRQKAKEIPYDTSETPTGPEAIKVFEVLSPLELALLPEDKPIRKRKIRKLPLGGRGEGDGWRPLSDKERENREKELAQKAVEMGAELADSLDMPYFSKSILWTTQRFNTYRHTLAEQYRLHLDLSTDDATLTYNVEY